MVVIQDIFPTTSLAICMNSLLLSISGKKVLPFLFLFFSLGITFFMVRYQYRPHSEEKFQRHEQVLAHSAENLYNYRVLPVLMTECLRLPIAAVFKVSQNVSFFFAVVLISILVYYVTQWAMFRFFIQTGLDELSAFGGVVLWVIILPYSLTGWDEIGDILNLFFFAVIFTHFLEGRIYHSLIPLALSAWNKEQTLLIPVFYAVGLLYTRNDYKTYVKNIVILCTTMMISTMLLHLFVGQSEKSTVASSYFGTDFLYNIHHPEWIVTWILSLGVIIFFAIPSISSAHPFLRYNSLITLPLFYIVVFFIRARMREIDKAFILHLFFIPLAVKTLRYKYFHVMNNNAKD